MSQSPSPAFETLYARALRWRVYALSLWLGRLALAPFGFARLIEPLLALPLVIGLVGGLLGPMALWPRDRSAAAAEALALAVSLVPAVGWALLTYGPPPQTHAALPIGTAPLWLSAAGMAWLVAMAWVGHRVDIIDGMAWMPSMTLLLLDQPPVHRYIFAVSPRLAESLAPLALVLAVFALARMEKSLRPAVVS